MIESGGRVNGSPEGTSVDAPRAASARGRLLERIGTLPYVGLRIPLRAAVSAYFSPITIRNPERIPGSGPLLVVANHPATLSEVFLLASCLGRRLHFLAASFIFQPWIRGVVMRGCGALPVYRKQDNPELTHRNEETFRACHEMFDRGGAVVIFPEGDSRTDRRLLPLKTGAARLALGYDALPGRTGSLRVLPVGLYFADRAKFQSEVIVSVGSPVDLAPFRDMERADPQEAVRQLTARLQREIESLILSVPNDAVAAFVHDVERLYIEDLRERRPGEEDLELLRRTADCIHHYRTADPERVFTGWRRTAAYRRKLAALRIPDEAIKGRVTNRTAWSRGLRFALGGMLGAAPAAIGALINFIPYRATGLVAGALAPAAIRVSAGRIVAGGVLFPAAYALEAAGLRAGAGWSWAAVAGLLLLGIPLGYFALRYTRWLRSEGEAVRLALVVAKHRRLLARLRVERKSIIRMFDDARVEYLARLAATENPSGGEGGGRP